MMSYVTNIWKWGFATLFTCIIIIIIIVFSAAVIFPHLQCDHTKNQLDFIVCQPWQTNKQNQYIRRLLVWCGAACFIVTYLLHRGMFGGAVLLLLLLLFVKHFLQSSFSTRIVRKHLLSASLSSSEEREHIKESKRVKKSLLDKFLFD